MIHILQYQKHNGAGNVHPVITIMGLILSGSICVTDLVEQINAGHSAGNWGKNGKIYANVTVFVNDEPDKFKNDGSICLNSSKEGRQKESEKKTFYIGNVKKSGAGEPVAPGTAGLAITLPGGGPAPSQQAGGPGQIPGDLPF